MVDLAVREPLAVNEAVVNITWSGQNGDLPDPVIFDSADGDLLQWAAEAIRGGIPGIDPDPNANLTDFVVERYNSTTETPNRILIRPKTPFGFVLVGDPWEEAEISFEEIST